MSYLRTMFFKSDAIRYFMELSSMLWNQYMQSHLRKLTQTWLSDPSLRDRQGQWFPCKHGNLRAFGEVMNWKISSKTGVELLLLFLDFPCSFWNPTWVSFLINNSRKANKAAWVVIYYSSTPVQIIRPDPMRPDLFCDWDWSFFEITYSQKSSE